jgi:hypothetical protein
VWRSAAIAVVCASACRFSAAIVSDASTGDGPPIDMMELVPITFVGEASAHTGFVSSMQYTLDVPSGNDRVVLVEVGIGSVQGDTSVPMISGVTFAGTAMAHAASIVGTPAAPTLTRSEHWVIVAPPVGSGAVVVTLNATARSLHSAALAFTGVDQTMPVRASATASGKGTSSSVALASAPGDLVVNTTGQGHGIVAPGTNQMQCFLDDVTFNTTLDNTAGSTAPGIAGPVTMTWTFDASDEWQSISSSLARATH